MLDLRILLARRSACGSSLLMPIKKKTNNRQDSKEARRGVARRGSERRSHEIP